MITFFVFFKLRLRHIRDFIVYCVYKQFGVENFIFHCLKNQTQRTPDKQTVTDAAASHVTH